MQSWGKPAQFNLGKSFAGYAPTGPAVVTLDEVRAAADLDALGIICRIADAEDGAFRTLQDGNSSDMIFSHRDRGARHHRAAVRLMSLASPKVDLDGQPLRADDSVQFAHDLLRDDIF